VYRRRPAVGEMVSCREDAADGSGGRAVVRRCTARGAMIMNSARGDRVSLVVVASLQEMVETTITPFRPHDQITPWSPDQITPKSLDEFTPIHTEPYVR
jgi:hypothetical protein